MHNLGVFLWGPIIRVCIHTSIQYVLLHIFLVSTASYSDQPLFTLKQVVAVCQHMLKEREERVREDYNKVLTTKLAGQMITSTLITTYGLPIVIVV